jgi:hypothetical protein
MKVVNHADVCDLNGSTGEVRLAVSYGDGHTGTAMVIRDGSVLAAGADLTNVLLGTAAELAGGSVVVRSTISQTNKSTPHFSAVHNVSASQMHESCIVGDVFDQGTSAAVAETITFK